MKNKEIDGLRFQGYGYKRIAHILGLSENTVKSYCRRHPFDKTKKVCLQCGKPIENTPHKREKKYCSDKCRLEWWNSHKELVNRRAVYSFVCENCGCGFESYGNNHRRYCSRRCFAEARRKTVMRSE